MVLVPVSLGRESVSVRGISPCQSGVLVRVSQGTGPFQSGILVRVNHGY